MWPASYAGASRRQTALLRAAMTVGIVVGLWVWAWRPRTRMGPLMFWWPASAGERSGGAFPDSSLVSTIGVALFGFGPIVFAHMALSYPTGRL